MAVAPTKHTAGSCLAAARIPEPLFFFFGHFTATLPETPRGHGNPNGCPPRPLIVRARASAATWTSVVTPEHRRAPSRQGRAAREARPLRSRSHGPKTIEALLVPGMPGAPYLKKKTRLAEGARAPSPATPPEAFPHFLRLPVRAASSPTFPLLFGRLASGEDATWTRLRTTGTAGARRAAVRPGSFRSEVPFRSPSPLPGIPRASRTRRRGRRPSPRGPNPTPVGRSARPGGQEPSNGRRGRSPRLEALRRGPALGAVVGRSPPLNALGGGGLRGGVRGAAPNCLSSIGGGG